MALYEVTVVGSYFGKSPVNRFNYEMTGTPAAVTGSFALVAAMGFLENGAIAPFAGSTLAGQWQALVTSSYFYKSVIAKNVYDVADFYELVWVSSPQGTRAGTAMSPTSALGFRSNRVRTDIDRGMKRFCGTVEEGWSSGGIIESAYLAAASNLAGELGAPVAYDDEGNTLTFIPCVVSKEEYTTSSGKRAYKYYPTLVAQEAHIASGILWTPYTQQRTQRSRQY